jgi:hypothetical protein
MVKKLSQAIGIASWWTITLTWSHVYRISGSETIEMVYFTCPGWAPEYTYDVAPLWFSVLLELCPGLNAIFVLGFTYVIYSVVAGMIDILIYRLEVEASKTEKKSDDIIFNVIGKCLRASVFLLFGLLTLSNLNINIAPLLASAGCGAFALALVLKDFLMGILGIFIVLLENPFEVGDEVCITDIYGYVEDVLLRYTIIKRYDGSIVMLPNSVFLSEKVINFSRRSKVPYFDIKFLVSHETSSEEIRALIDDLQACPLLKDGVPWYNRPHVHFDPSGMKVVWELMARGQLEDYVPYREKQIELTLYVKDMCKKNNIKFVDGKSYTAGGSISWSS